MVARIMRCRAKPYYGRGPIQLSYPYNYGQAGADLGLPLLAHPELVSQDGSEIAFRTAIWFWMRADDGEPSLVTLGHDREMAADFGRI